MYEHVDEIGSPFANVGCHGGFPDEAPKELAYVFDEPQQDYHESGCQMAARSEEMARCRSIAKSEIAGVKVHFGFSHYTFEPDYHNGVEEQTVTTCWLELDGVKTSAAGDDFEAATRTAIAKLRTLTGATIESAAVA